MINFSLYLIWCWRMENWFRRFHYSDTTWESWHPKHWNIDCSFNSLIRRTSKKTSRTDRFRTTLLKGHYCGKRFHVWRHHVVYVPLRQDGGDIAVKPFRRLHMSISTSQMSENSSGYYFMIVTPTKISNLWITGSLGGESTLETSIWRNDISNNYNYLLLLWSINGINEWCKHMIP